MPAKRPPTPADKYRAKRATPTPADKYRAKRATPTPDVPRRSNVSGHDYNPETRQLTVTFHNGRQYRYSDIGQDIATDYEKADSKGAFLHQHIIGKFAHEQLPD